MTKADLRLQMRALLAAMDECAMVERSARIVAQLQSRMEWFRPHSHVALFGGIHGEPDLSTLVSWMVMREVNPVFFGFENGELMPQVVRDVAALQRGMFGVFMPAPECPRVDAAVLDVVFTPGLAFDHHGRRLGRGRGFFDKLFARCAAHTQRIGVCLEEQIVDDVPCESHDMRVHGVVTDQRCIAAI